MQALLRVSNELKKRNDIFSNQFSFITCVFVLKARSASDLDAVVWRPVAGCLVAVNAVAGCLVAVHPADDTPGDQPSLEAWRDNKDNIYRPNARHRQQWH